MNILTIKTSVGSTYIIDQEKKTWKRGVPALSGQLRIQTAGIYTKIDPPKVGHALVVHGTGTLLTTSPIVKIDGEI